MSRWKSKMLGSFNPALTAAVIEAERLRAALEMPRSKAAALLTELMVSAASESYMRKKPVVWMNALAPSEIVVATGASPFCPEIIGSSIAWLGLNNICLLEAERIGVPPAVCASHRATVGAVALEILPVPDAFVCTTDMCEANLKAFKDAAERFEKPLFVLDIPALRDDLALGYVTQQLGQLVEFLSDSLRSAFRKEGLAEAVERSNAAREAMVKLNDLRKVVSLSSPLADLLGTVQPHFGRIGLATALDAACVEISKRPKVAGRPRLLWLDAKPRAGSRILRWIEKHGASIVFEEASQVCWQPHDPTRPLTSIAAKTLSHYASRPMIERFELLLDLIKEYQIDGVVALANPSCRRGSAIIPHLLERLNNAAVPAMAIDGKALEEGCEEPFGKFLETLREAA